MEILTIIKTPKSYIQLSKLATQVSNIIERVGLLHDDVAHYHGLFHDFKRFGLCYHEIVHFEGLIGTQN